MSFTLTLAPRRPRPRTGPLAVMCRPTGAVSAPASSPLSVRTSTNLRGGEQLCQRPALATLGATGGHLRISGNDGHEFLCASDDVAERHGVGSRSLWEKVRGGGLLVGRWPGLPHLDAAATGLDGPCSPEKRQRPPRRGRCTRCRCSSGRYGSGVLSLYLEMPRPRLSYNRPISGTPLAIADLITTLLLASGNHRGSRIHSILVGSTAVFREIHQATGMVVAQLGVSVRVAYARECRVCLRAGAPARRRRRRGGARRAAHRR